MASKPNARDPDAGATGARSRSRPRPAGRSRRAWTVLAAVAVAALAIDLGTKYLAFATLAPAPVSISRAEVQRIMRDDPGALQTLVPEHEPTTVIPSVLQFQLVLNSGAVFGAGQGQRWLFVGFTVAALAFALFMFARWTREDQWLSHSAIALIIAGGVGNLYDRLMYACVRDFIHPLPGVRLPFGLRWPQSGDPHVWPYVSNVADAFLLIGISVLLVRLWREDPDEEEGAATAKQAPKAGG